MSKIKKAIFPVAGMGTRFLPITKASPKEMLPLVDKPLIQYVVEEAIASGIEEIAMITGRGKNSIEDYFDCAFELENVLAWRDKKKELDEIRKIPKMCDVWYIRQKEPLGLGHAILRAKQFVGNEPFAVLLGDDIIYTDSSSPVLKQLMDVHDETGASVIALEEVDKNKISSYGVVDPEWTKEKLCKINKLVEKPPKDKAPSNLAIIGRYVLTPAIFDFLEKVKTDKSGEIQLTDGLNALCEVEDMHGYSFDGKRYDAGNKLGFLIANVEFALRDKELGEDFGRYLSGLKI